MTPAQAETTPAKGKLPRNIPPELWEEIQKAETYAANRISAQRHSLRATIVIIAQRFNFEENELIARGVITPRREPTPYALKGGH